jgi:hypothetical protein
LAETALVAAGLAAGADLAFDFAGAAFTETALVALAETGLAFAPFVVVALTAAEALAGAGAFADTFTADALVVVDLVAFAEVFASDFAFDFFSTLDPPKAAAQPSV